MNKQTVITSLTALALISSLTYGVSTSQAFFGQSDSNILSKVAQRFGTTEEKATQVMQEIRLEKKEQLKMGFEAHLEQAVENGELTTEQQRLILEKKEQLQKECDGSGSKIQQHREELVSWAQENNIDPSFLMGMGQGNGQRMMNKNKSVGQGRYRHK